MSPTRLLRRARSSKRLRLALVLYAVLLLLSHLWTDVLRPAPEPDSAVTLVEVPQMTSVGPVASGETMNLGVRGWVPVFRPAPSGIGVRAGAMITGVRTWTPDEPTNGPAPLLLLHGSPSGGSSDFEAFGPELARAARRTVLAIDRPGFGASDAWVESYAVRANAHAANAVIEALGYPRAHAVGWSQGGGAALWMPAFDDQLISSVTIVGSIGIQEGEGSGDYYFEHGKYALGYALVVALPETLPHFGLLGARSLRHAFMRDFWDTDQRPIRGLLEAYTHPLLVVHGRDDPLVPAWAAEEHQRITPGARLLMLDASHFFVFRTGERASDARARAVRAIADFVAQHDDPDAQASPRVTDEAPADERDRSIGGFAIPEAHWLIIVLVIAGLTLITEDLTVIGAGLLVSTQQVDVGVAMLGCFLGILVGDWGLVLIGRFAGRRVLRWRFFRKAIPERSLGRWEAMFDKHLAKAVFLSRMLPGTRVAMYVSAGILSRRLVEFMFWMTVAIALWIPVLMLLAILIGRPVLGFFQEYFHGPVAVALAFLVLFLLIRVASYEATYSGRHKLASDIKRVVAHEFWPSWIFYLPLGPWLLYLACRHRGALTITCADPGIQPAGGIVQEPKTEIVRALEVASRRIERPDLVLPARRAPEHDDPVQRARETIALIEREPALGGFPVVLKPEAAQRGFGIRVCDSPEDIRAYLEVMSAPVQVQRYHPGPVEAGVLWSRVPTPGTPVDEWPGELFAITRKTFPVLEGNGEDTVEHLIWEHPRYRMQANVFLRRFEDRLDDVLEAGATLALTRAGNHAQGTMFSDGPDLATPELARVIEELSQAYRHEQTGGRLDFGRYDLRATSEEDLRAGRFAVVELNGVLSEATNLYDPERSLFWAYRTLFRQWERVYRIGGARRREGVRPASFVTLVKLIRADRAARPPGVGAD